MKEDEETFESKTKYKFKVTSTHLFKNCRFQTIRMNQFVQRTLEPHMLKQFVKRNNDFGRNDVCTNEQQDKRTTNCEQEKFSISSLNCLRRSTNFHCSQHNYQLFYWRLYCSKYFSFEQQKSLIFEMISKISHFVSSQIVAVIISIVLFRKTSFYRKWDKHRKEQTVKKAVKMVLEQTKKEIEEGNQLKNAKTIRLTNSTIHSFFQIIM
jgi:hypothetical protein